MKKQNIYATIVAQPGQPRQSKGRSPQDSSQQLELFPVPNTAGLLLKVKAQISTVRGICLKDPNKYQVTLGSKILGTHLTFDEAVAIAKRGAK